MSNQEHVEIIIKQGVDAWNRWRGQHSDTRPEMTETDLSGAKLIQADLSGADLAGTDLSGANLTGANLNKANLCRADLTGADLSGAKLIQADLSGADLTGAQLTGATLYFANLNRADLGRAYLGGADLNSANLSEANLGGADLSGADLTSATLVETNLENANLNGCRIYGISAWNLKGAPGDQLDLIITRDDEPVVKVDNIEVAQFIYLLLRREKLRNVIDTITSKAVLILGRFTPERKVILNAIAAEVRTHHLLPIIFDFERSTERDFTETIKILAGMSLFVIADITNPKSAPLELQATVPDYQIPFVPIIQEGEEPFSMLSDLIGKYDWVLAPVIRYPSLDKLREGFKKAILDRAWEKRQELQKKKMAKIETQSVEDFLER
jgi:uncharacterized protein YjbI with pentapeptide repeats